MAAVAPPGVAAEFEALVQDLRELQQVNYWQGESRSGSRSRWRELNNAVGALTALVYDIAITFGDEVSSIAF